MCVSGATSTLGNCCAVTAPCVTPSLVKKTPPTSEFHLYIYISAVGLLEVVQLVGEDLLSDRLSISMLQLHHCTASAL